MWTKHVIKTGSESALSLHGFVELARPFWTKEEDSMWDQRKKEDRGPCFQWLHVGSEEGVRPDLEAGLSTPRGSPSPRAHSPPAVESRAFK